ncbi:MAG: glycoside hydrolase family 13 protein [Bdellovibrionota bacterium]
MIKVLGLLSLLVISERASWAQFTNERPTCVGAKRDGDIWWAGLDHNSFEGRYRRPFGAVSTDQGSLLLRFRTCANDVTSVRLTVWESRTKTRKFYDMHPSAQELDEALGPIQYWDVDLEVPKNPDILYYFFDVADGSDHDYYIDDDIRSFPGGRGQAVDKWDDTKSFQISVYDKDFQVPEWAQGAIVYKIFPDRFRNGDPSNDPKDGTGWVYGQKIRKMPWAKPLCDPYGSECPDEIYNLFYGGDLKGIEDKLDDLKQLGVSVLYMNPIFESPTNHRYDTTNFKKIDPMLGNLDDFHRLAEKAKEKGIHLLLDGVFNHVSADSPYFDLFGRWNSKLELTSPQGSGSNDGSGACESDRSEWRSWFFIPDIGSPALFRDRQTRMKCANPQLSGSQGPFDTYEAWFGFFNVPKLNTRLKQVRDFFFQGGPDAVAPYWLSQGASGWRLDVGADIDAGWTQDPGNSYWEDFRRVTRATNPDSWIVGEEWGNASPWLLGKEWDSVMNYRLRSALLNWMFDACRGQGCYGRYFSENDSNENSPLGPIFPTTEAQFLDQLQGIQESYPEPSWKSAMNLLGSHDTNRILFLLKKISNEDSEIAHRKLIFLAAFQMTYPGAPSIYYGDEVGVDAAGTWRYNTWIDDPYNRAAYPWADQGMRPDLTLQKEFRRLGQLRASSPTLQKGDFEAVSASNESRVFSFTRNLGTETYLIVMNRQNASQNVVLSGGIGALGAKDYVEVYPNEGLRYKFEGSTLRLGDMAGLGVKILKSQLP